MGTVIEHLTRQGWRLWLYSSLNDYAAQFQRTDAKGRTHTYVERGNHLPVAVARAALAAVRGGASGG